MYESIARMQQVDGDVLMCMDYLLAGNDYLEFVNMMLDFKVSNKKNCRYNLVIVEYALLAR